MAINLSNVNISLDEFQKISSGWFNAGEVRLKDEHTLAKVNHHVETWFFSNKEKIDHKEVLAIKQAFVNALSQHGIQGDALARVRQGRLGVCPGSVPFFPPLSDKMATWKLRIRDNGPQFDLSAWGALHDGDDPIHNPGIRAMTARSPDNTYTYTLGLNYLFVTL